MLKPESSSPETNGGGTKGMLALITSTTVRASKGLITPSLFTSGYSETSPSPLDWIGFDEPAVLIRLMIASGSRGETTASLLTSSGRAALCQGEAENSSLACSCSKTTLRSLDRLDLLVRSTGLFFLPNTACSPNASLPSRAHRTCKSLFDAQDRSTHLVIKKRNRRGAS